MLDSLNEFLKKSTTLGLIFSFPTLFYVLSILYCRLFVCTIVTLHGRVETVDRKQGNWCVLITLGSQVHILQDREVEGFDWSKKK